MQIFRTRERNTWTIVLLVTAAAVVMLAIALRDLPALNRSSVQPAATTESANATATQDVYPSATGSVFVTDIDGPASLNTSPTNDAVAQHLYPSATGTAFVTDIDGPASLNTSPTNDAVAQHLYPSATGTAFVTNVDGPAFGSSTGSPLDTSAAVTATRPARQHVAR